MKLIKASVLVLWASAWAAQAQVHTIESMMGVLESDLQTLRTKDTGLPLKISGMDLDRELNRVETISARIKAQLAQRPASEQQSLMLELDRELLKIADTSLRVYPETANQLKLQGRARMSVRADRTVIDEIQLIGPNHLLAFGFFKDPRMVKILLRAYLESGHRYFRFSEKSPVKRSLDLNWLSEKIVDENSAQLAVYFASSAESYRQVAFDTQNYTKLLGLLLDGRLKVADLPRFEDKLVELKSKESLFTEEVFFKALDEALTSLTLPEVSCENPVATATKSP